MAGMREVGQAGGASGAGALTRSAPPPSDQRPRAAARIRRPAFVFWLLFGINVVNYLDRFIAIAVGPTLKARFHLHDEQVGLLTSAFLLIYTLSAIPLGLIADRVPRTRVVAIGVGLWSLASGATAFIRGFRGLVLTRAAVGIGEASYFPAGTALLSAYYPQERRARIMSRWNAGQLVGIALAFTLTALLAHLAGPERGWRLAFFCTAPPGILLALLMWRVAEGPGRAESASSEGEAQLAASGVSPEGVPGAAPAARGTVAQQLARILRLRTVVVVILLQALTFAVITPTVTFLPIYVRAKNGPFHLSATQTDLLSGVVIVLGGIGGTMLGGAMADWLGRRTRGGRVLTAGLAYAVGLPCFVVMLLAHVLPLFVVASTFAVLALSMPNGPLAAAAQDVTPPALRATSVAVILLCAHLLGDVWSPSAVGALSTHFHEHANLALLLLGLPSLAIAAVAGILGARFYAREAPRTEGSESDAVGATVVVRI
jgi:MFS family permease